MSSKDIQNGQCCQKMLENASKCLKMPRKRLKMPWKYLKMHRNAFYSGTAPAAATELWVLFTKSINFKVLSYVNAVHIGQHFKVTAKLFLPFYLWRLRPSACGPAPAAATELWGRRITWVQFQEKRRRQQKNCEDLVNWLNWLEKQLNCECQFKCLNFRGTARTELQHPLRPLHPLLPIASRIKPRFF